MVLSKKFYIVTVSVFLVLMAIFAIGNLDFHVSSAIINEHSLWARFFDVIGEVPAMLAILVGITLLYGGRKKTKPWWNVLSSAIFGLLISLFSAFMYFNIIRYIYHEEISDIPTALYGGVIILMIANLVAAIILAKKYGHKWTGFKAHAWLLIVVVFTSMISVNVIKSIWARPRMRSISDISEFKHWYEISGWSNDNELKSFPSGHTANAWIALTFMIFVPYFKSIKMNYFIIAAAVWGTLVALSRVVLGAHFLSDVLVGSYITIFLFIFFERVFLQRTKKSDL